MTINNQAKKIISSFLIISMILPVALFSIPKQVNAAAAGGIVFDPWNFIKNTFTSIATGNTSVQTTIIAGIKVKEAAQQILMNILKLVVKRILARITQATI